MREAKEEEFTFDNDATYMDSGKDSAAYSYQGTKQMSGLFRLYRGTWDNQYGRLPTR